MWTYEELKPRLARSKFRSRFKLGEKELQQLAEHGLDVISGQCQKILTKRLAPALPAHDGHQTPMRGHACFIAQHATGCCCRRCLEKWHGIPRNRPLSDTELDNLVAILISWIREQSTHLDERPHTPDLF